jgi:MFS family permease
MSENLSRPPAWLTVATGMLIIIAVLVFARLAFGLVLPAMREGLGLSYQQAGNLGTATALGYLALVLYAGGVAARRGGRFAVMLGITVTTAGFAGLSLVPGYLPALALMVLLGVGTAFGFTPLISLVSAWYPKTRGSIIGFLISGVGFGMLLSGWMVPRVIALFDGTGWRQVWMVFACGGVLAWLAAFAFLKNPPLQQGHVVTRSERRQVFRNPHVITVGLLYGVIGVIYIVQSVFMYSFAVEEGVSPIAAGNLTAVMGLLVALSGPGWGWFGDRFGRGLTLLISTTTVTLATALPVVWPEFNGFVAHYLLLGAAMNGMFITILAIATERVSMREAPVAVSFVTVFFATGQLVGPVGAGILIELGGFRMAFGAVCLALVAGIFLSLRLHRFPTPAAAT